MSFELFYVRRGRMLIETSGPATFGKDASGSIGSFQDMRFNEGKVRLGQAMLRDERVVQRVYEEPLDILGKKDWSMDLSTYLLAHGTGLGNAASVPVTTPVTWFEKLVTALLGGFVSNAGSTHPAGSTTDLVKVANGDAVKWDAGRAYGVLVGGVLEAREIASTAAGGGGDDDLNPKCKHTAVPDSGGTVYNARTMYLKDENDTSMQFVAESRERDDIWWLYGGGFQSASIEFTLGELVKFSGQIMGPDWEHDDDVGTPLGSGSSLAVATYTDSDGIPFLNNDVIMSKGAVPKIVTIADGTTGYGRIDASAVKVNLAMPYQSISSPGGVNGVRRWKMRPGRPVVTVEITFPYQVETLFEDRNARTTYGVWIQVGNQPGYTWLISIPRAQIIDVQMADSEGLVGQTVTLKALEDNEAVDQTNEIQRSPFRMHRL